MEEEQKIEFYQTRKFGDKINITVEFIRQNFKTIFKVYTVIFMPFAALMGLLLGQFINFAFNNLSDPYSMTEPSTSFLVTVGTGYLGFLFFSVVAGILMIATAYNLMKHYHENYPEKVTPKQIFNMDMKHFWKILGYNILVFFGILLIPSVLVIYGVITESVPMIILSVFLYIGVLIYFLTVLSLGYPAMVLENLGPVEAISRSFKLIKEKFWSTFGLLFITYLAQSFIAYVFAIPFYIFYFSFIITMAQGGDPSQFTDPSIGFKIGIVISFVIMFFGQYLTSVIPFTALGFQFTNLVERRESRGLMQEIENLNQGSESDQEG